jgi:hypothetical protein
MNDQPTSKKRESRYVKVARLAYAICQNALPSYAHKKSPHHFTFPQLAACVLVMNYLKLSYRDMEEWLLAADPVVEVLELPRIPDHSTLQRTFAKLRKRHYADLQETLLKGIIWNGKPLQETLIAADATGYRDTQASAYYQTRSGKKYRRWIQGGYAVGCDSQFILACRDGYGPSSDAPLTPGLKRDARRYGNKKGWLDLADAGFDGQTAEVGDLIPPIRRGGNLVDPQRIARREWVDQARLDGVYGQRWKCETVNSVIKRKLGDAVRSRKARLQRREPALKALVYNLHR